MFVFNFLKWALLILLVQSLFVSVSEGATYNFYINNTENGIPTVTLNDDKKKEEEEKPEEEVIPPPLNTLPPPMKASCEVEDCGNGAKKHSPWRVGLQVASVNLMALKSRERQYVQYGTYSSYQSEKSTYEPVLTQSFPLFSLTYLFHPNFGLSGLVGAISGVEGEANLFPSTDAFQFGFMLGYGTPKISEGGKSSAFFGMQMGLDFADICGLQLSWRKFSGKWASLPVETYGFGAFLKF